MSKQFENLKAWQKAKDLTVKIYKSVESYPKHETFALSNQTTRASVSIAANIAEGSSRKSLKDFGRFLEIALGSAYELETLLIIAFELRYFDDKVKEELNLLLEDSIRLICGLKRKLLNE